MASNQAVRRYPLIIEGQEGNYSGYFPDLPGCTTGGRTIQETRENAKEALLLYLEDYPARGADLPEASEAVRMELIEVSRSEVEAFALAGKALSPHRSSRSRA